MTSLMRCAVGLALLLVVLPTAAQTPPTGETSFFRGGADRTGYYGVEPMRALPAPLWEFDVPRPVRTTPAVADGLVYIGSEAGTYYALDAMTGAEVWTIDTSEPIVSTAAIVDGVLYVGGLDDSIYALDAATGDIIWEYETDGGIYSSAIVVDGVLFVGSLDDHVYALDAATGDMIWRYETKGDVWSSPAVADGMLYIGSRDTQVYALDAATGELVWRYTTGGNVDGTPAVANGTVFIGDLGGGFHALDAETGAVIWSIEGTGYYASAALGEGPDGTFVVSMDIQGVIRVLQAEKGDLLWQAAIGGPAYASPTLAGDVVYALTEEGGLLYAFDALTGDELWREVTGREGDFRAASPVPYDNRLFVSSNSMGLLVYRRLGSG